MNINNIVMMMNINYKVMDIINMYHYYYNNYLNIMYIIMVWDS